MCDMHKKRFVYLATKGQNNDKISYFSLVYML